jgi:hypothetical protein
MAPWGGYRLCDPYIHHVSVCPRLSCAEANNASAIVGMVLLPSHSAFRTMWMKPVWGAANLGTVVLWPLATIVQFGVGRCVRSFSDESMDTDSSRLFYERTFHSIWPSLRALAPSFLLPTSARRAARRPLSWRSFFSFGSMGESPSDLLLHRL